MRLISEVEREAKLRGAGKVHWGVKQNSPFERLLQKRQYKVRDVIYMRDL